MNIKTALKKLEDEAGIGRRCLNCRVHYIKYGDEIKRTAPADLFATDCGTCGRELKFILSGFTPRERKVAIYVSTATAAEQNGAKWVASYSWLHHLPRQLEIEKIGAAEETRLRGLKGPHEQRQVKTLDQHARHIEGIVTVQGDSSALPPAWKPVFDAHDELQERRKDAPSLLKDDTVFNYSVMAEMEVFMWGEKSEETLKLIEDRRAERVREARELLERLEREKQERERERAEREERYRLESEQRNRELLERNRASVERNRGGGAPAPVEIPETPPPRSRFVKEGATVPVGGSVYVPDPVDPTRHMIVSEGIAPEFVDEGPGFMRSSSVARKYYRGTNYDGDPRY